MDQELRNRNGFYGDLHNFIYGYVPYLFLYKCSISLQRTKFSIARGFPLYAFKCAEHICFFKKKKKIGSLAGSLRSILAKKRCPVAYMV